MRYIYNSAEVYI